MDQKASTVIRFGPFALNCASRELRKFDRSVRLRPQASTVLVYLASRRGELVTREELRTHLWSDETFVDFEHGINFCIRQIRQALGENATAPRFIETIPKRGYRFLAPSSYVQTLAVLPFEVDACDRHLEYLADGIPEDLIRKFASLPTLRVLSWNSTSRLRRREKHANLSTQFGVTTLLRGKVRSAGQDLHVSADLEDVSSHHALWGGQYNLRVDEVSDIQDKLFAEISRALKIPVSQSLRATPSGTDAHHHYLKGRFYLNKYSAEGFRKALAHLHEAIERDPVHALAFTALAECYGALAFFGFLPPHESWPKAQAAAKKALEIDATIAEAHACLGMVALFYNWNPQIGIKCCREAVALGRSSPSGHRWLSCCHIALGEQKEALASAQNALELDPLSAVAQILISTCHYFAREYEQSAKAARKALLVDINHAEAHRFLGIALLQLHRFEEGERELQTALELMGETPATLGSLGRAYALQGKLAEAEAIIKRLTVIGSEMSVAAGAIASIKVGLGRFDEALQWLKKSVNNRSSWMTFIGVEPWWDPLRNLPEFKTIAEEVLRNFDCVDQAEADQRNRRSAVTNA